MVRSVICGMDSDAQRGVGITIPGLVKIHLEKTVSKMTPTLKLSVLWEEGLTRSPAQGLTTQIFLEFCEILYVYTHTDKSDGEFIAKWFAVGTAFPGVKHTG